MKTFIDYGAQGDCVFIRIDSLPEGLEKVEPEKGKNIVAHSETGHNHVMTAERTTLFKQSGRNERDLFKLFAIVDEPTELVHERSYHTHETLLVPKGIYSIHRQRQWDQGGYRKVVD